MFRNKLDENRLYSTNIMANGRKYNEKCVKNETIHEYFSFTMRVRNTSTNERNVATWNGRRDCCCCCVECVALGRS